MEKNLSRRDFLKLTFGLGTGWAVSRLIGSGQGVSAKTIEQAVSPTGGVKLKLQKSGVVGVEGLSQPNGCDYALHITNARKEPLGESSACTSLGKVACSDGEDCKDVFIRDQRAGDLHIVESWTGTCGGCGSSLFDK